MSNDGNAQAISSNIGCCFLIKHSETCRQLKKGTLLLIQGVALVAIAGSIVAILAMNGLNLGGINTITALIAEKWIYITFVTGASLLTINTVLIAALTRSYYNKQYTQREIDNLGLGEWVEQGDILAKLEPGQYWRFPAELEQPVRGDQGRSAMFGAVVRDVNNNIGVYAFRTEEDFFALIHQLGYRNGESAFTRSEKYTHGFIGTKTSLEQKNAIAIALNVHLSDGEYHKIDLQLEIDGEARQVYGLRVKKDRVDSLSYFKTRQLRQAARVGLLKHAEIKNAIQLLPALPYLPAGSFWEIADPIGVTPYGEDQEEKELYVLIVKERGATPPKSFYFSTQGERTDFADSLADDNLIDANEAWNNPTYFPNDWVEAHNDLTELNDTPLRALEYAYATLESDTTEEEEIFALRIQDSSTEVENLYFRTEEARNDYIESSLSIYGYRDIQQVNERADQLIDNNYLNNILEENNVDCWLDTCVVRGVTSYLIFGKTSEGIKPQIFSTEQERTEFLQTNTGWQPVNTEQSHYLPAGEYKPGWVSEVTAGETLQRVTQVALGNNQCAFGQFQTNTNRDIFWVTSQNGEGVRATHYFVSEDAVQGYIETHLGALLNLTHRNSIAVRLRDRQLLNFALARDNDFWGESNVRVGTQRVNILFNRVGENIEISYPEALPTEENEHNIKHMIEVRGEYPQALGARLKSIEGLRFFESHLLKGECCIWTGDNINNLAYPKVYIATIRNNEDQISYRYFKTDQARGVALNGLTNGFIRERHEQNKAIEISKAVNASLEVKVDHCVPFDHNDKTHCVFVSKEGILGVGFENKEAPRKSTYDGETKGLENPTAAYNQLVFENSLRMKSEEIQTTKLLDIALSEENDCWGVPNVQIGEVQKNILFKRGAEGVEVSYPDDLQDAMNGLNDIKKMIEVDGEFPTALGAHLRNGDMEFLKGREPRTFNGECRTFNLDNAPSLQYPNCFVAHFKEENSPITYRYFTTTEARKTASEGKPSSFSRELKEQKIAIRKSTAVNEVLGDNAVDHCAIIDYQDKGKLCVYIPKDGNIDRTTMSFFTGNVETRGLNDPSMAYNEMPNVSVKESKYIDENETESILNMYLGEGGKLTKNTYYAFEKNGIFGLLWVVEKADNEDTTLISNRLYFKSADARAQHIEQNLQGVNPFVEEEATN